MKAALLLAKRLATNLWCLNSQYTCLTWLINHQPNMVVWLSRDYLYCTVYIYSNTFLAFQFINDEKYAAVPFFTFRWVTQQILLSSGDYFIYESTTNPKPSILLFQLFCWVEQYFCCTWVNWSKLIKIIINKINFILMTLLSFYLYFLRSQQTTSYDVHNIVRNCVVVFLFFLVLFTIDWIYWSIVFTVNMMLAEFCMPTLSEKK